MAAVSPAEFGINFRTIDVSDLYQVKELQAVRFRFDCW